VNRAIALTGSAILVLVFGGMFWFASARGAWETADGDPGPAVPEWVGPMGFTSIVLTLFSLFIAIEAGLGYPRLRIDQLAIHYLPGALERRAVFPWAELTFVTVYGTKVVGQLRANSPLARPWPIRRRLAKQAGRL
jgi:hypothetical protein